MKQPPARHPSPRIPSGLRGRPLERPMPLRPPKPSLFLIALALLPSACFDPQVTGTEDGSDGDTTAATSDDGMTEATATVDPDGSSGDPLPVCGNGVIEGDEACDDGVNDGSYGGCSPDCTAPGPSCGDGTVNGEEPCDDGDDVDGNGCNVDCVVSGTVLWTVTYDGPDHQSDAGFGVAIDPDDNVLVSGDVNLDGNRSAFVRKYTSGGAIDWTSFFPSEHDDSSARSMVALADGDIIFGGRFDTANTETSPDAWIQRVSSQSDQLWVRTHASPQGWNDEVTHLDIDEDGYIYALFSEEDRGFVRKYDQDGNELWSIFFDDTFHPYGLGTDADGRTVIVGNDSEGTLATPYIVQLNREGGTEWEQVLDEYDDAYFDAVDVNADGAVVADLIVAEADQRLVFFDSEGASSRAAIFPHTEESVLVVSSLALLDTGDVVAGGLKGLDGHLWVTRYAYNGDEIWTHTYNGEDYGYGIDVVTNIDVDSSGNIVAVGTTQDVEATIQDVWVTKFAP